MEASLILASQFKRRGWVNIARYLEQLENGQQVPQYVQVLSAGEDEKEEDELLVIIPLDEPCALFQRLLSLTEQIGEKANESIAVFDECLAYPDDPRFCLYIRPTFH